MIGKTFISLIFIGFTRNSLGLSPVILIPGDGGSQLEAKLNKTSVVHYICAKTSAEYFNIWLNLELLVPFVIDCWVDNLRLEYDPVSRRSSAPAGVRVRAPGWGLPAPVEWLDPSRSASGAYFSTIADALVADGYRRNLSIRGAPYDFRKAPNENGEFFVKLRALVEETYWANGAARVTLVAHSMGGNMAALFLRAQPAPWKARYVRRLVALSAPWAGSVKALKVFAIGDDLGSAALRASVLRAQQVTCPSLAWLLPAAALWRADVLLATPAANYTARDLQQLFTDMDLPLAWEMRKDTEPYASDLSAPGVELHCVYGHNVSTVERLSYGAGTWLDGRPTLHTGDGDGTVNARSLTHCARWGAAGHNEGLPVRLLPLKGAEHLRVLHDPRAIAYLRLVLRQP